MRKFIIILTTTLLIAAQSVVAAKSSQQFEQWTMKCVPNDEGGDACHIFQEIVVEQSNDKKKAVRMSLGYAPDDSDPVTIIRMPLGLWLLNGITLAVADGPTQRFPIQVCAPAGCQTTLRLQPNILDTLKAGSRLTITIYNTRQEPVQIPIDLRGFSAALEALQAD